MAELTMAELTMGRVGYSISRLGFYCCLSWQILMCLSNSLTSAGEITEYCERESFHARCRPDEVIVMSSAIYGRMRMGHCVRKDYGGVLGCQADVLPVVHSFCSGKRECEFPISDLHSTKPCPTELLSYLAASYDCVPVSTCSPSLCKAGSYLRVPTSETSGYIGGITTTETGCGSADCPWVIEPRDGQRLNLTFYFFQSVHDQTRQCHRHAAIYDKKTKVSKDITVCSGGPMVTSHMTSESSAVEIKVFSGRGNAASHILIGYKVVGCPPIKAPLAATVRRSGDTLTVSCDASSRSWHLTCNGNAWVGEVGVCNNVKTAAWNMDDEGTTPQGLAMVVGIGVALGILLGFSLLGLAVYCMRRHRSSHYQRPNELIQYTADADKSYDPKMYDQTGTPGKTIPTPDSGYYTGTNYQGPQQHSYTSRHMTSPRDAQHGVIPPSYFHNVGAAEAPYKFRDHVYESPNFKQQEDTRSIATAAST